MEGRILSVQMASRALTGRSVLYSGNIGPARDSGPSGPGIGERACFRNLKVTKLV